MNDIDAEGRQRLKVRAKIIPQQTIVRNFAAILVSGLVSAVSTGRVQHIMQEAPLDQSIQVLRIPRPPNKKR